LLLFKQKVNNPSVGRWLTGGLFYIFLTFYFSNVQAVEIKVLPGYGKLQAAINVANSGDVLILGAGSYFGSINIDRSLTLLGNKNSIIDGEGAGHVIVISAADVVVKGLTIQHSGNNLNTEDSAIFVTDKGNNALIKDNHLKNNLIGIYLKGPKSAIVDSNRIIGSRFHRVNDRGNGVYLWNTPGSIVKNNDIHYGRDGIFVNVSHHNVFSGNRLSDLRFAIHYMYTNNSEISNNISINNNVGYALMFSHHIVARNNQSIGDHERGLFFNFTNYSTIEGNSVSGGTEKCVFIYNANFNIINNNLFKGCNIGIHFTAGSEKNNIYENAFINNQTQVKYVGSRYIEWSHEGKGNFWSDNVAFDIDNNGIADQQYRPNDLIDQIVWRHPMAKLLLNSPAVQVLKWAQSEFPGLHPGGVTDSLPLMLAPNKMNIIKENRKEDLPNG